eukprot:Rhum_TRINITY_DN9031_c0_g1::Rhum_TRINITY_DN9031_c0_g1_i1::g.31253::m.31253
MVLFNINEDSMPHDEGESGKPFDRYADMLGVNVFKDVNWEDVSKAAATGHRVQAVIAMEMNRKGKKAKRVIREKAKLMAEGFTSGFSGYTVSFLSRMCEMVGPQVYTGVFVEEAEYAMLRETAKRAAAEGVSLIILPSHKSHIDYIALSYLLFRIGVSLPCVAAGDNLNIPMVGELLRRAGGFFIRRTFTGEDGALYTAVVNGFIEELLNRGINIEFFPEGGRSRTGKLLQPKVGLLGMIMGAILDGRCKDAIVVPVSVQYDRLMEAESYARELLGAKKQKETVGGLVDSIKNTLANSYSKPLGGVHIRIADGFSIREYMTQYVDRKLSSPRGVFSRDDVMHRVALYKSAAYRVMDDINGTSTITPSAVVATVLLTTRGRGVGREELVHKTEWLKGEIELNGGRVSWPPNVPTCDIIDTALLVLKDLVVMEQYLEPVYSCSNHLELSFYRNSIVHLFVEQSLVAASLHSFMRNDPGRKFITRTELMERVAVLSNLVKAEFVFTGKSKASPLSAADGGTSDGKKKDSNGLFEGETALETNFRLATECLVARGTIQFDPVDNDKVLLFSTDPELWSPNFTFLCMLVWPFIESYWLCLGGIIGIFCNKSEKNLRKRRALAHQLIKEESFVKQLQLFGLTLYHLGNLSFYESVSKESLRHALMQYTEMGAIQKREVEDVTKVRVAYLELGSEMKADVDKLYALEESIRVFRRSGLFQKSLEQYPEHLATLAFTATSKL